MPYSLTKEIFFSLANTSCLLHVFYCTTLYEEGLFPQSSLYFSNCYTLLHHFKPYSIMKLLPVALLWLLSLSMSFAQSPVHHEFGIDLGVGMSGVLYPERAQFSPAGARVVEWSPSWSQSTTFKYNALLFNKQLNLGIGLGFQRRGYIEAREWDIPNSPLAFTRREIASETLIMPLEIGYRWNLGEKHSLMADALFIPTYHLVDIPFRSSGDENFRGALPFENRFSLDLGLKLGYRYQLTEKLSLQASVLGTWEPLEHTVIPQEMYNIQLVVGARYQF